MSYMSTAVAYHMCAATVADNIDYPELTPTHLRQMLVTYGVNGLLNTVSGNNCHGLWTH